MSTLRIVGGVPLHGTLTASGNKNAALPMIAACLLTDERVELERVPDIGDVRSMLAIAEQLGAGVEWHPAAGRAVISGRGLHAHALPATEAARIRAGILFAAPLLARLGQAEMPPPGGDVIGRRRLDSHLYSLAKFGAEVDFGPPFRFTAPRGLTGADLLLPEASVTGTAQAVLAAVLARGESIVANAACEPHIQDLCHLLVGMGASIEGIGGNLLRIRGVERLGGTRHRVSADFAEAGSYLAAAAATRGDVTVTGLDPLHFRMIRRGFSRLGIELEDGPDSLRVPAEQSRQVRLSPGGGMPVVDDGIWPQFPTDLMSVMIVLATQVCGTVLFFEKMYESRMYFVDRLVDMGANAVVCDPHRAVISGPSQLHGITLNSPDIRAGMALVSAALCARGESQIRSAELIDRGYPAIEHRLRSLGARIERAEP
ncbi:MAG: UDP-N-acetylglucosamine 1-carboxyvinyltransferase [Lentisphaeria bacterium]|nr:UDP-N-acetylglucosamine 1-carboxyvinyltransferase [Lentisphaeria bacterium]